MSITLNNLLTQTGIKKKDITLNFVLYIYYLFYF